MSITITGGISFSGALSIVAPPPSVATAGWFAGGTPDTTGGTKVDRITFATDTATATTRGPLAATKYKIAGTGTLYNGWFGGGYKNSVVQRITYATDTATASVRGPLSLGRSDPGATSDSTTYGWFGGGYSSGPSYTPYSTVDRITFSTDTDIASVRGPLATGRFQQGAAGNTNYGWHVAGGFPNRNSVDRIEYAVDTATASFRVSVTSRRGLTGSGTDTYGWFGGGYGPSFPGRVSLVERITYATDTAAASTRGPLTFAARQSSSTGDDAYGWFGGGGTANFPIDGGSTVCRITYASDTATATNRGPLSGTKYAMGSSAGLQ
jgi:hypothetical protein